MLILIPLFLLVFIFAISYLAPMSGRIARKNNHPQAKVIRLCGWTAILSSSISAWVLALMWAHNDSPEAGENFQSRIAELKKAQKAQYVSFGYVEIICPKTTK